MRMVPYCLTLLVALSICACSSGTGGDDGTTTDVVDAVAPPRSHAEVCKALCAVEAECGKACDYHEEPGCNEQENYDFWYSDCLQKCVAGEGKAGGACVPAADAYAKCQVGKSCASVSGEECQAEFRRYYELCVTEPGTLVCFHFCTALEIGCLPYQWVGFRGPDCDAACMEAAQNLECLEGHYQLDECMRSGGYACTPMPDSCVASAQRLDQKCTKWQAVEAVASERSTCQTYAQLQCECGLYTGDDCQLLATERCLYQLGYGHGCTDATGVFYQCMNSISQCTRDKLRETCLAEWDAYWASCSENAPKKLIP